MKPDESTMSPIPLADLDRLEALWPTPEPPPDFAERVLAACARPAPRRLPRWLVTGAACAAAILLPLVLLQAHPEPRTATAQVSRGADLGLVHD